VSPIVITVDVGDMETEALDVARHELHRLRAALTAIQTHAALLAATAAAKEQDTLGYGLEMIRSLAGDALEGK
jgi:hypothetical protein